MSPFHREFDVVPDLAVVAIAQLGGRAEHEVVDDLEVRRPYLPLLIVLLIQSAGVGADFTVNGLFDTDRLPPGGGEAGDDTAIWVHPTDTSLSVIVGVSKASNASVAGLYVYNLDGRRCRTIRVLCGTDALGPSHTAARTRA